MEGNVTNNKKFGILLCAEDTDYVKKMYGGYFGVFVRMLEEKGETWDLYRVTRGEFPDDDELETYDGFVVSGSSNDAHGNEAWICRLVAFLKRLDSLKIKVLGICFGHQILSRALGGKSGRSISGWDIGTRTVHFSSSSKLVQSVKMPALLSIYEIHRDEVWELPPKAERIAWSDKTRVEMFRYGDHIMGIQGHPEYTKDILLNLIDRLVKLDYIEDSESDELKAKVEEREPDREALKRLCLSFLKGGF
ncbi:Glutamine amidotransferase [Parasponia andersonii]|uniref:Glutamine amidotransferase n=1 Tax=Parasponia andersonii TaxID=3476 RepID=A0A2P5DET7_PARAD|nr:Glutamine amidotransferase [Parasponia andersonii]